MLNISLNFNYNWFSVGVAINESFNETTQKVKEFAASPKGRLVIGIGIGICLAPVYGFLENKIFKLLGISPLRDPFNDLSLGEMIILMPVVCLIGPTMEEVYFRGMLQDELKENLESFYTARGFSNPQLAARGTAVFFTAVIFGLVHFTNALPFWCNPILFLPQVIFATISGLTLGLAKEFSGDLPMPIGMHIGNNTVAWALYIANSI